MCCATLRGFGFEWPLGQGFYFIPHFIPTPNFKQLTVPFDEFSGYTSSLCSVLSSIPRLFLLFIFENVSVCSTVTLICNSLLFFRTSFFFVLLFLSFLSSFLFFFFPFNSSSSHVSASLIQCLCISCEGQFPGLQVFMSHSCVVKFSQSASIKYSEIPWWETTPFLKPLFRNFPSYIHANEPNSKDHLSCGRAFPDELRVSSFPF